jgi:hypothetical protein
VVRLLQYYDITQPTGDKRYAACQSFDVMAIKAAKDKKHTGH